MHAGTAKMQSLSLSATVEPAASMIVPRPRSGVQGLRSEDVGDACARPSKIYNALAPCLFRLDSEEVRCVAWVWSNSQRFVNIHIQEANAPTLGSLAARRARSL